MTKPRKPTKAERQAEAGRRTGLALKERYGPDYFRDLGAKGGRKTVEKLGAEHLKTIGTRGGNAVASRFGSTHFAELAKAGRAAGRRKPPALEKEDPR